MASLADLYKQYGQPVANFLSNEGKALKSSVSNQVSPMGNGVVGRSIDALAGGNSIVGNNGYFNQQVIQPIEQGVKNYIATPNLKTAGMGALGVVRGGYNATPLGLAVNAAIAGTSSTAQAIRTGQANPLQAFNENQQLSKGLGVNNPYAADALDLATNSLAMNPEGSVGSIKNLGNLSKEAGLVKNAGVLFDSAKQLAGVHTENTPDLFNGPALKALRDTHEAGIPQIPDSTLPKVNVMGEAQPQAREVPVTERSISQQDLLNNKLKGKPVPDKVTPWVGGDKGLVKAKVDAQGNVLSWAANDPAFEAKYGDPVVNAANNPGFTLEATPQEMKQAAAAKANIKKPLPGEPSLEGAQFRSQPVRKPLVQEGIQNSAPQPGDSIVHGIRSDGTFGPVSENSAQATASYQARSAGDGLEGQQHVAVPERPFAGTDPKQALLDASSIQKEVETRGNQVSKKLLEVEHEGDQRLIPEGQPGAGHTRITELINQAVEHPDRLDEFANQTRFPQMFKEAIQAHGEFTDFLHSKNIEHGVELGYRENYLNHTIDLTDPAQKEKFANLTGEIPGKNYEGSYVKSAHFDTIDEARAAGFDIKKQSAVTALNDLISQNSRTLRGQALVNGVNAAFDKGAVMISETGGVPHGYTASRIPGLQDTAFSPEAQKLMSKLEPASEAGAVGKVYDKGNADLKETSLSLGGFHQVNIGSRFLGSRAGGLAGGGWGLVKAIASDTAYDRMVGEFVKDGTVKTAGDLGVNINSGTRGRATYDASIIDKARNLNPIHWINDATFRREQNYVLLKTVQGMKNAGQIPESAAARVELGKQINALALTVNKDVVLRDPNVQRNFQRAFLAPSVTEAKVTQAAGLFRSGPAGNLARGAVVGQIVAGAIVAELGRKLVTGKFSQSLKDAFINDVVAPSVPLPWKSATGKSQVANLPVSGVSELGRPIYSALQGDNSGLARYAESRVAAIPSAAIKAATNTDYYGNQIVSDPNAGVVKRIGKLAASELPIAAVQANKVAQGNQGVGESLINTAGFRVGNDPTAPEVKAQTAYFQQRDAFTQGLDQNELALFNDLNPAKKASDGTAIPTGKGQLTSPANAAKLAANPAFAQKYAQYQLSAQTPAQGDYQSGQSYQPGQAVTLNGQTYVALKPTGSVMPGSEEPTRPGDTAKGVWAFQDPIWKLKGDDLTLALQARAATGLSNKNALDPNAETAGKNSETYFNNFPLFQGERAYQQLSGQGNYDPIYDLNDSQAKQVLYVRNLAALDNGSGAAQNPLAASIKAQDWYKQFQGDSNSWYSAHPLPASAVSASSKDYPAIPDELQRYATYISGLGTPAAKAQAYATPQGRSLDAYYAKLDQYNSQKLSDHLGTPISVAASKYAPGYRVTPGGITGAPSDVPGLSITPSGSGGSSYSSYSSSKASAGRRMLKRVSQSKPRSVKIASGKIKAPAHTAVRKFKISKPSSHKIKKPSYA